MQLLTFQLKFEAMTIVSNMESYQLLKSWREYCAEAVSFSVDEASELLRGDSSAVSMSPAALKGAPFKAAGLKGAPMVTVIKRSYQECEQELMLIIPTIIKNQQASQMMIFHTSDIMQDNLQRESDIIDGEEEEDDKARLAEELSKWASHHRSHATQTNELLNFCRSITRSCQRISGSCYLTN